MLTISDSVSRSRRLGRRGFLQAGALAVGGLTLPNLLQLRAEGANRSRPQKSVIMVYLHGGPPQMDMFDMKPNAPVEIRGEFDPIRTNVPGLEICELMPKLATIADKYAVIRNMTFKEYVLGHNPPLVYTGYFTSTEKPSHRPTFGSVFSHFRGQSIHGLPPYVAFDGMDTKPVRGTQFLGVSHNPFVPGARTSGLLPLKDVTPERYDDRRNLLTSLDKMRRDVDDARGNIKAVDDFSAQALDMITTSKAHDAFDINREPDAVRALYGEAGTQFLQARRLVEAGVPVVTLTANKEPHTWDKAGPWDTHGKNFITLRKLLPELDQSLFALLTDLSQRGLDQDVAVVVLGEMGRTPKINNNAGGRDPSDRHRRQGRTQGYRRNDRGNQTSAGREIRPHAVGRNICDSKSRSGEHRLFPQFAGETAGVNEAARSSPGKSGRFILKRGLAVRECSKIEWNTTK
ncbi:MAG: hypothetical protein ACI9HK_002572 [Pirellulaceae bacterium]|jgi:hypothetical protein